MTVCAYTWRGIHVRDHRGAEPPGHPQPAGVVGAIGRRDRAPAADASSFGVQAPPRAARGGLRGVARRSPAARLSDPARAAHGGRCLARSLPALLDGPRRCARTPSRPHGAGTEAKREPMSQREKYAPGAAAGAEVKRDGEKWTLILVRELRHPPAMVWQALTDPAHLSEWAPFDADRNLAAVGPVKLSTVGTPTPQVSDTTVKRAEAPRLLEYSWGGNDLRWELEPLGSGTRLTLWHNIDRRFISWGAAGWHICLDVLERLLTGEPIGCIVGGDAMKFGGWQRLNAEYAKQFGVETHGWQPNAPKR